MSTTQEKFDMWAVVELFGHTKIAGRCTERSIAGTNMLQVDVPETQHSPAFSRLLGGAAIYAINPCDEEIACAVAERLQVRPIQAYEIRALIEKQLPAGQQQQDELDQDHEDDEFYDER